MFCLHFSFPPLSYKKFDLNNSISRNEKDFSTNSKSILNDNTNRYLWNKNNSTMSNNIGSYNKVLNDAYTVKNYANKSTIINKPTIDAKIIKEKHTGMEYIKSKAINNSIISSVNKDKMKKGMKDREKHRKNCLQSLQSSRYYSPPHSPSSTIVLTDSSSNSEINESLSSPSTFTSALSSVSFPHFKSPKSTSSLSTSPLSNGFLDERYQKSIQLLQEVTNGFNKAKSNVANYKSGFWNDLSNKTITQNDKDTSFWKPSNASLNYSHQRNNYRDNDLIVVSDEENNIE